MSTAAPAHEPVRRGAFPLVRVAQVLLAAWAVGIVIAGVQLGSWREELSRTLLQLNADAQFRARARDREAVDPEWYRRKALALLSASERVQRNGWWSAFIPGSWQAVDSLEEQVQARLAREFNEIVVETMRRELYARASQLTGVPLVRGAGELQTSAECQSPVPQSVERRLSAAAEDLPEFVAIADYVAGVERLDGAVQSFLALQQSSGSPEQLRQLVSFTLGKNLPGALAGAVRMFQAGDEVSVQPALMQSRLQWATRCSLVKAMTALHTRLLNTNDLFALEQGLVERSHGLFEPATRVVSFDRTLERYRAVHALLDDQNALLAKGRNDWMRQGSLQLGPAYQQVLQRIAGTRLLGPEVVQQLQGQSGAAFAEFRRQFEQAFGSQGEPGIVWLDTEQRFGLSSERAALRDGLGALLKTSFMAEEPPTGKGARDTASLAKVVQEAKVLAQERARVVAEVVPTFPEHAQPVVSRVIDSRVSELVYQRAFRVLKANLAGDAHAPLDPVAFKQQREQVLALQSVLKETGGAFWGDKLVATLDGEVLRRLGGIYEEWAQQPLLEPRTADFAWWQGEPLALAKSLGSVEPGPTAPSMARTATRLDLFVQRARGLMNLASPGVATEPAALRWQELQAEVERYARRDADSSLLRLERYVGALGSDLRRENCAERLAANQPAVAHDDDVAQRHLALHQALMARCAELRAQAPSPTASMPQ